MALTSQIKTMNLDIQDLGAGLDFQETWDRQEALVAQRRTGQIGDTFLLLEHAPVYTIGRTRDQSSLRDQRQLPHPLVETNRGGEGTYHGPGQLVGYAILDLANYHKDLHRHLRNLEEAIIETIGEFGITAQRHEGLTGVWIDNRKIASLGVGIRSWVTLHGLALNVQKRSLQPFQAITPCGIADVSMTSLESETGKEIPMSEVKTILAGKYQIILDREALGNAVSAGAANP
ncbi:lipoyl(octanoyl) transferase LipB [bacterium]|nr:lipoyl(octanoyl) transferase LipB [bacterium]MDC0265248.1 lipoyl(octanoyl) transferase LipB [bacterium]